MILELFDRLKNDLEKSIKINDFLKELRNYIEKNIENIEEKKCDKGLIFEMKNDRIEEKRKQVKEYRKEGHIYLVTEDRGNKIYVWDYTEKPDYEVEEFELPQETLNIAHEGTMLKYKNGKYELYSKKGYDKLLK